MAYAEPNCSGPQKGDHFLPVPPSGDRSDERLVLKRLAADRAAIVLLLPDQRRARSAAARVAAPEPDLARRIVTHDAEPLFELGLDAAALCRLELGVPVVLRARGFIVRQPQRSTERVALVCRTAVKRDAGARVVGMLAGTTGGSKARALRAQQEVRAHRAAGPRRRLLRCRLLPTSSVPWSGASSRQRTSAAARARPRSALPAGPIGASCSAQSSMLCG